MLTSFKNSSSYELAKEYWSMTPFTRLGIATAVTWKLLDGALDGVGVKLPLTFIPVVGAGVTGVYYLKQRYYGNTDPRNYLKKEANKIFGEALGPVVYNTLETYMLETLKQSPMFNDQFKTILDAALKDKMLENLATLVDSLTQNSDEIKRANNDLNAPDISNIPGQKAAAGSNLDTLLKGILQQAEDQVQVTRSASREKLK